MRRKRNTFAGVCCLLGFAGASPAYDSSQIGNEVAIPVHLRDGEEYQRSIPQLLDFGRNLFTARWTVQEGAGRPLTNGAGGHLVDSQTPLVFPRNFNRISAPDTNSCAGCHNAPDVGGGGDIVSNVFVLAQRFDFATFNLADTIPMKGALDERGLPVTLQKYRQFPEDRGHVRLGFHRDACPADNGRSPNDSRFNYARNFAGTGLEEHLVRAHQPRDRWCLGHLTGGRNSGAEPGNLRIGAA